MSVHDGHRSRMRERFCREGLEGFAPHEVLELLLCYAKPRGNLNPLAHELLNVFGSLKGVFEATPEHLMAVKGVGQETATLLGLILPMFRKYQECICAESKTLRRLPDAERYCIALNAEQRFERLYLISVSSSMRIVGVRMLSEGSIDEVPAYPRKVVEAALNHNAYSVILCHNHPGGIAEPSPNDLMMTAHIESVLEHLGIRLIDHIIVGGGKTYSMCLNGQVRRTTTREVESNSYREKTLEYVWRDEGELSV